MDNPPDQEETPNRVPHVHHHVLKGGPTYWAECDAMVKVIDPTPAAVYMLPCGHKLAGDNGPIVGSRAKVKAAIAKYPG